jgi:hypothetical protein
MMKKTLGLFVSTLVFASCIQNKTSIIQTIKTNKGWGYMITNDKKILIKQTIIPVISQIKSFKTESDALKVGNLVLQKLNNNLSPTVTKKDLILLDIKT